MKPVITNLNYFGVRRCAICQERLPSPEGCTCRKLQFDGQTFQRFRFGEEEYDAGRRRCRGCGTERGGYHHVRCEKEICPMCGEPIQICGCDAEYVMPD